MRTRLMYNGREVETEITVRVDGVDLRGEPFTTGPAGTVHRIEVSMSRTEDETEAFARATGKAADDIRRALYIIEKQSISGSIDMYWCDRCGEDLLTCVCGNASALQRAAESRVHIPGVDPKIPVNRKERRAEVARMRRNGR